MSEKGFFNVKVTFSVWFRLESDKICKNKDHTCLLHCINICRVPRAMFEHLALQPRVQTTSAGTQQMLIT